MRGQTQRPGAMQSLISEIDLELEAARDRALRPLGASTGVLERVAIALASTLELREVLSRLAEIGQQATGADHSSLFLLEGRRLVPAVAVGRLPDEETWEAFRAMGPVHLAGGRWDRFVRGRPIAIEDARDNTLIPGPWLERFRPGAVILVPLVAEGTPCGLLAVDWDEPRTFSADELSVLEAIGRYAGVAVRNARAYEDARRRARLQEALTRSAAALAAPFDARVIAERLVGAYSDLIGARLCAIALFDTERSVITAVAARGTHAIQGPIPMADLPRHVVTRVWREWQRAKLPLEFANEPWFADFVGGRRAGAGWYLLSPLVVEGHTRGAVLLGFEEERRVDAEERTAIRALSEIAAAALERCTLLERQDRRVRQLDALYRVNAALTEGALAPVMTQRLNELLGGLGIEVEGVAFREERLAARLGAHHLTPDERAAWRSGSDWVLLDDGRASVPMRLGKRLFGALRVRAERLDTEERAFLETLARGLAEAAKRDDLRVAVEEAARDRLVMAERDRMASDLHDTAGQVLVAIGLLARDQAGRLEPDTPLQSFSVRVAELADQGKWEIDQAARALAFVPATRRGLVASLRALVDDVRGDSGIDIRVSVRGPVARFDATKERALYRVAHEALANAWRHGNCENVQVELMFRPDEVALTVADDGGGAAPLTREGTGISSMRRTMRECGGALDLSPGEPAGLVVEARVSREAS